MGAMFSDIKARLTFGEAASALGLKGSSKAGWDCVCCGAPNGLQERQQDHRGARCCACSVGLDVPGLVMRQRGEGAKAALAWCEAQIAARDARAADGPGLSDFDTPFIG